MEKFDKTIYVIVFVFILLVLSGFYFMFDKVGNLKTDLKNAELSFQLLEEQFNESQKNISGPEATPENNPPPAPPAPPAPPDENDTAINAAILFTVTSSPSLQPQTKITVMIERAAKAKDGTIKISFKAFTNEANSYSAFEPRDLFEIINLTGENFKPLEVNGKFDSIPPQSSVSGDAVFKIAPDQNTLILQTGSGDDLKFYEFNFLRKTYKETTIG